MKLVSREDIALPIETVFARLTDFAALERGAMRRGAEVRRIDRMPAPGVGMAWNLRFAYRGRPREMLLDLSALDRPNGLDLHGSSGGFEFVLALGLVALSRQHTRLLVELVVKPQTLTARFMMQSARLGKKVLQRRFDARVQATARGIHPRPSGAGR